MEDDIMRISITLIAVLLTLAIVVIDYQMQLGIAAFLSDFFVVFLVVAIALSVIGIKSGR